MVKKRNPIISLFLSSITPGLGHVYNTQYQDAIKFYIIFFVFTLVFWYSPNIVHFLIIPYAIFHLYLIFHATKFSFLSNSVKLRKINKGIFYFGLFLTNLILLEFFYQNKRVDFYHIDGGSMSPTLQNGDRVTVFKGYYETKKIKRGDVVTFKTPEDEIIIQRVIGLPGDRVSLKSNNIILNDEKLILEKIKDEKYKSFDVSLFDETLPNGRSYSIFEFKSPLSELTDDFSEIIIPSQEYFLLGDNRDNSMDSRFIGIIPEENIMDKVLFYYWSDLSKILREIK